MTFGLVQAVKLTFIASWLDEIITFSKYLGKEVTSQVPQRT